MVKFVPRVVFARIPFFLLVLPTGNFSFYFEFIYIIRILNNL